MRTDGCDIDWSTRHPSLVVFSRCVCVSLSSFVVALSCGSAHPDQWISGDWWKETFALWSFLPFSCHVFLKVVRAKLNPPRTLFPCGEPFFFFFAHSSNQFFYSSSPDWRNVRILLQGPPYSNDFITFGCSFCGFSDFFSYISFLCEILKCLLEKGVRYFVHICGGAYMQLYNTPTQNGDVEAEAAADPREYTYSRVNRASQPAS